MQPLAMTRRVRCLNARFDALTLPETVEAIFSMLAKGPHGWLCTVNVAILMMMRSDERLQAFVDRAVLTVADGQPLVWLARLLGDPLPERVTGIDLVDRVCARAAREGKRVYLLGATHDIVAEAAKRLRARHAGLRIDYGDGYFGPSEAVARAARVRATGAQILFVGMGVPRQERFLEEQWETLRVRLAIGVGGSFDVLAGARLRAPGLVQKMGLEWLFRLAQEPGRLYRRYRVTNGEFLRLALDELLKRQ